MKRYEMSNLYDIKAKSIDLTVIILTLNEEKHIERCLRSAFQITSRVFVVDSFSTDHTVEIARSLGANIVQRAFKNHADQLQWGVDNCDINTAWVMNIDADEVISPALAKEILRELSLDYAGINGYHVNRLICFNGKIIIHGGASHWVLRLWRNGMVKIEQRWMDDHVTLKSGDTKLLKEEFVDNNLNNITWWTNKHNSYATREAIDLLNSKYGFLPVVSNSGTLTRQARRTRWLKENIYIHLPLGLRAFLFFAYRMIFRLGILDGRSGFTFHFLQGFWYRYLVDIKVQEVEHRMRKEGIDCVEAIQCEFGINPLP